MISAEIDLHVRVWGAGERVVLVHGSNSADPGLVWARQQELATRYQLYVPDRRGYGESPPAQRADFEVDVRDVHALLGEGAHLVGLSYGGILTLLAAARRPELVKSLTVIEPPAFGGARDHPLVERLIEQLAPLYAAAPRLTPEAYIQGFARAFGEVIAEPVQLSPEHRRAIIAAMGERPPWEAEIPLDTLAAAGFPKLVVSGDWHPAFEVVAEVLAWRLGARRAIVRGAGHGAPSMGRPFNARLEALMRSAAG